MNIEISRLELYDFFFFFKFDRRRNPGILGIRMNKIHESWNDKVRFKLLESTTRHLNRDPPHYHFRLLRGRGWMRRRGIITALAYKSAGNGIITDQVRFRDVDVRDGGDTRESPSSNLIHNIINRSPSLCIFPRPLCHQFNCHFCGSAIIFTCPKSAQPSEMPARWCP